MDQSKPNSNPEVPGFDASTEGGSLENHRRLLATARDWSVEGREPSAEETAWARAHAKELTEADGQLLYDELTALLLGRKTREALQWLQETGILAVVLPELDATVSFSQEAGRRHKDVWDHTKTVVWQAVPTPVLRWSALLHDIGKVPTRVLLGDGRVTFHGHAEVGERMFRRGPARRIRFPKPERRRIGELIRYHLRPGQYEPGWTDAAVRRFARDMGPCLPELLNLSRADVTSRRPGQRRRCLRQISALARRVEALKAEDARPKPLPAGLGGALMQAFSLPPGPHLGVLRTRLAELCSEGSLEGGADCAYYVDAVRERRLLDAVETIPAGKKPRLRRES